MSWNSYLGLRETWGKMVDLRGVFHPFGGLMGAPEATAEGDGLLEGGIGLRMRWMDCLANFGPLQLDFNCVKPC